MPPSPPLSLMLRPKVPPHAIRPPLPSWRLEPFFKQPWHKYAVRWGLYRPLLKALGWTRQESTEVSVNRLRLDAAGKPRKKTRIGDSLEYVKINTLKRKQLEALNTDNSEALTRSANTPYPALLHTARQRFRKHRGQTSSMRTIHFLKEYETMLDDLASGAATSAKRIWDAETKAASHLEQQPKPIISKSKPTERPHLTGGFLHPSLFNPPLPRLRPQPEQLSMMMRRRIDRRERRIAYFRDLQELQRDMKVEVRFLRMLGLDWPEKIGDWSSGAGARSWDTEFKRQLDIIDGQFAKEAARSELKYTDAMYIRVMRARKEKQERLRRRAERRKLQQQLQNVGQTTPSTDCSSVEFSSAPESGKTHLSEP